MFLEPAAREWVMWSRSFLQPSAMGSAAVAGTGGWRAAAMMPCWARATGFVPPRQVAVRDASLLLFRVNFPQDSLGNVEHGNKWAKQLHCVLHLHLLACWAWRSYKLHYLKNTPVCSSYTAPLTLQCNVPKRETIFHDCLLLVWLFY